MSYYIYIHYKPDGAPFYVGKGHGKRAYDFHRRSSWYKAVVKKYGSGNIRIGIVLCESEVEAFDLERKTIADLRAAGHLLCNFTDGGEGSAGYKPSPEENEKRATALRGRKRPPEVVEKMRAARLGMTHSPEAREKISAALRLRIRSPETSAKISAAKTGKPMDPEVVARIAEKTRGRKHTAEHKAKIAAAHLGKKRTPEAIENMRKAAAARRDALLAQLREASKLRGPVSDETRRKQSETRKGRTLTPEHKAKLSVAHKGREVSVATREAIAKANTGKQHSPEAKARMSAARKAYFARRKAAIMMQHRR